MAVDIVGRMSSRHCVLLILLLRRRWWIGEVRVRVLLGVWMGLVAEGRLLLGVIEYHGSRRPRS